MKNILRISVGIITALITLLAVVSCQPEAEITGYDYKSINLNDRPGHSGDNSTAAPTAIIETVGGATIKLDNPKVTIAFPDRADITRAIDATGTDAARGKNTAELKKFLSFRLYTSPTEIDAWAGKGMVSELKDTIDYEFTEVAGDSVVVTLKHTFAPTHVSANKQPNLVLVINPETYTFSYGNKMDRDRNGKGGEKGYDDLYIALSQGDVFAAPARFMDWNIALVTPQFATNSYYIFTDDIINITSLWDNADSSKTKAVSVVAANLNLTGMGSTSLAEVRAAYSDAAALAVSGINLQRFANKKWENVAAASYDADISITQLLFKNVELERDTQYRVRWTGKADLVTSGIYFGLKQRVFVDSNVPATTSNEQKYTWKEVVTLVPVVLRNIKDTRIQELNEAWVTANVTQEITTLTHNSVSGSDIIIKLNFPIEGTGTTDDPFAGLKVLNLADFRKAFKIVYRTNASASASAAITDFTTDTGLIYVDIAAVEFKAEGLDPADPSNDNTAYLNAIYITLDPKYMSNDVTRLRYFLINDGLKYEAINGVTSQFGNRDNILYGNFALYGVPVKPAVGIPLGAWQNGNIATTGGDVWFTFMATSATHSFYINNSYTINDVYYNIYRADNNAQVVTNLNVYGTGGSNPRSSNVFIPGDAYNIRVTSFYSQTGALQIMVNQ